VRVFATADQHRLETSSPPRPRPPTSASSKTGGRQPRARVPHRGAQLVGRQAAKQRGRTPPHVLRFSSRVTRATTNSRKRSRRASST
jgi:hypothetical protein